MKSTAVLFFSVIVFGVFTSFSGVNSGDWVLQKNENGIAVYTRAQDGSSIKEVRVVNKVSASLSSIVALMLEIKKYPTWVYACSQSSALKIISNQEMYNYEVTDLPWPMSDRDVVCHFTISQDSITRVITITKTGVPQYIPENKTMVRVPFYKSTYWLTPMKNDSVKMELELSIDPGGNLPAWLINTNVVTGPYKTTEALVQQLPRYQQVEYSFIKE